jgi:hypothetical protein
VVLVVGAPLPDRVPVCCRVGAGLLRVGRSAGILRTAPEQLHNISLTRRADADAQCSTCYVGRVNTERLEDQSMRSRVLELCIKHMMHCWINTVLGKLANVPLRRC